jgi:hypothetical protein
VTPAELVTKWRADCLNLAGHGYDRGAEAERWWKASLADELEAALTGLADDWRERAALLREITTRMRAQATAARYGTSSAVAEFHNFADELEAALTPDPEVARVDAKRTEPNHLVPRPAYRIALRPDDLGLDDLGLDDVVVNDVSMFRLERLGVGQVWACCYLADSDERITWCFTSDSLLTVATTECPAPSPECVYEAGSLIPPEAVMPTEEPS